MDPVKSCDFGVNDSGTSSKADTGLTQRRSLDVPWGFTYFVRRGDFIKIGHSAVPKQRMGSLQVSFPDRLKVLAVIPNSIIKEPDAHAMFAHLYVSGEWFRATPELLYFISKVKEEANQMPKRKIPNLKKMSEIDRLRHHLSRLQPHYEPQAQAIIENLMGQLGNFDGNPDGLRPMMLRNIEKIEAVS